MVELCHEPANRFVAGFLGAPSMNVIEVRVDEVNGLKARIASPPLDPIVVSTRGRHIARGDTAILGVRPQHLHPADDESGKLHGSITLTEQLGAETVIEVKLRDAERLVAALTEDRIHETGARIGFDFNPGRAQPPPPRPCLRWPPNARVGPSGAG